MHIVRGGTRAEEKKKNGEIEEEEGAQPGPL